MMVATGELHPSVLLRRVRNAELPAEAEISLPACLCIRLPARGLYGSLSVARYRSNLSIHNPGSLAGPVC